MKWLINLSESWTRPGSMVIEAFDREEAEETARDQVKHNTAEILWEPPQRSIPPDSIIEEAVEFPGEAR